MKRQFFIPLIMVFLLCVLFCLASLAGPVFAIEDPDSQNPDLNPNPYSSFTYSILLEESDVGCDNSGLSEEEAKALFSRAEVPAAWFAGYEAYYPGLYHRPDNGLGKPVPEGTPEKIEEDGKRTYILTPYGYNTEEIMAAHLQTMFSEEVTKSIMDSEFFISRNGFLYEMEGHHGSVGHRVLGPGGTIWVHAKRTVDTAERVVFSGVLGLYYPTVQDSHSPDFADSWIFRSLGIPFEYVLEKQNGQWIFTSFRLPYLLFTDAGYTVADLDVLCSPATGDSTVFLLPAAALSLGGVLLAAKKRKRAS